MTTAAFTVKYGRDRENHRFTYATAADLDTARSRADAWAASWAGVQGGGEFRVWVEDTKGKVVYGQPAERRTS